MKRRTRDAVLGVLLTVIVSGCAGRVEPSHEMTSRRDPALTDFYARVEQYLDVRAKLWAELPQIRRQRTALDPTMNQDARAALASRLQQERAAASQGDIFTPAIAATLRARLDPALRGGAATDTRAAIRDDAPAKFTLRVNESYPEGASLPTMPSNVLAVLPPLPPGLEYRIVDVHLILRDTEANIIVDYLRDVMCQKC